MGRRTRGAKASMKKSLKGMFKNLPVDERGLSRPLGDTCTEDPRDIGEETFLYFKDVPEPYPLEKLRYVRNASMLPSIAEYSLKWLELGVLQLLDGIDKSNYMSVITCFIPFFVLNVRNIMFPGEKEPRLISDMTASGVNECCYSLKWNMSVIMEHVKHWSPDTVFISFDLSKAYLQVRIPEPLRRFFGVYLPAFPGSPFGREVFGVLSGMPFGFKPAGFILRHQTDWILRNMQSRFPWLGHHLWVDDFLFYMNSGYTCKVPDVVTEFDRLVAMCSHKRNVKKSVVQPGQVVVHNGIEIDTVLGTMSLPTKKCERLLSILRFTSGATDAELLALSVTEWETYKGVLSYVGYVVPLLKCWLSPWYKFCNERGTRPRCAELRESAAEMLSYLEKTYGTSQISRKMHLMRAGSWTLWDLQFDDAKLDDGTMIITVDSSRFETGIFIPTQPLRGEMRVSVPRSDLGSSCANELHGALYAITRFGGERQRVVVYNDNKATVKHINNARAKSSESNIFVKGFVHWLTWSGSAVVAKWVPGVLLHHADDQSRMNSLQSTSFYLGGTLLPEESVFLFDPRGLSDSVWVWDGLEDVFQVICPRYEGTHECCRIYAEKRDHSGLIVYNKLIPGSFIRYLLNG